MKQDNTYTSTNISTEAIGLDCFVTALLHNIDEFAIILVNLEGLIRCWNEGATLLYGYAPSEVIDKKNFITLSEQLQGSTREQEEWMLIASKSGRLEKATKQLRKDGHVFMAHFSIIAYRSMRGEHSGYLYLIREIKEEKHVDYDRVFLESVVEAFFVLNPDGYIIDANDKAVAITGHNKQSLLVCKFHDLFVNHTLVDKLLTDVLCNRQVVNYEIQLKSIYNGIAIVSLNAQAIKLNDGASNILVSARDVTAQKQLEQELRNSLLYSRSLIEASVDAMMVVDVFGKIIDVNKQMARATNRERNSIIGTNLTEYFIEKDAVSTLLRIVLEKNTINDYELTMGFSPDNLVFTSVNAATFYDEDNKLLGVLLSARDITKRKRSEEELKENNARLAFANTELEAFTYIASHDLQEPLRMITSFSELVADRYADKLDKDGQEFLAFTVKGAHRMQELIKNLLLYTKSTMNAVSFVDVDLNVVMTEAMEDLHLSITEKAAVVTYDTLPVVKGDPIQLRQLLENLIGNSIKFCNQTPVIKVSATKNDFEWIIAVKDNGIGIDPKYNDRIFKIFQTLNPKDKYPGSGIGLAIAKKIVSRHGGKIWFESTINNGSTFYFSLPVNGDGAIE